MNIREKVKNELAVQESIIGEIKNKDLILKILNACKTQNEFRTFVKITHHRYGKLSYECHTFYDIQDHLLPILGVRI